MCGLRDILASLSLILLFAQSGLKLGGAPSSVAPARDHLEFLQACRRQIRQQEEDAEEDDEVSRCVWSWPARGKGLRCDTATRLDAYIYPSSVCFHWGGCSRKRSHYPHQC